MIKAKLQIAKDSWLPYLAAVLAIVAAAAYVVDIYVTMEWYWYDFAWPDFSSGMLTSLAWVLQVAGLVLLAVMMVVAAKRCMALLVIPTLLHAVGTVLMALENNDRYYMLMIAALVVFYFFAVTMFNGLHSKVPVIVLGLAALAGVAVLCVLERVPFLGHHFVLGYSMHLSLVIRTAFYYLSLVVFSTALTQKFEADVAPVKNTKTDKSERVHETAVDEVNNDGNVNWALLKEEEEVEKTVETAKEETMQEKEKVFSVSDWLDEQEEMAKGEEESSNGEPVVTVPLSGSRLQKSLKEEIVCDRDQKLMYKKKVNLFSVIGLVLSGLAIVLSMVIIFRLVDAEVFRNDTLGLMMLALGLCMLCVFGTRLTYKEYYTKTIVTERKVMREESNWEEFIANRLEEDERSIASLTDSYAKMTEMYGRLLETTAELAGNVKALTERQEQLLALGTVATTSEETPSEALEEETVEGFTYGEATFVEDEYIGAIRPEEVFTEEISAIEEEATEEEAFTEEISAIEEEATEEEAFTEEISAIEEEATEEEVFTEEISAIEEEAKSDRSHVVL